MTNEYEKSLLQSKAGLTDAQLRERVRIRVTTLGRDGVDIVARGGSAIRVPAAQVRQIVDPTGGGDAFRAGFLAATSWGLGLERAGQVGCCLAALALEEAGGQEYQVHPSVFIKRLAESYGPGAAADVEPQLAG